MRRGRGDYLFCGTDWFSVAEGQRRTLQSEIDTIDGNRLLNTSVDDLCDFYEGKFRIEVPELHEDQIVVDQQEIQIDVSQDQMRYIRDRSRAFHVAGTFIEVTVPFFSANRKLSTHDQQRTRARHPGARFGAVSPTFADRGRQGRRSRTRPGNHRGRSDDHGPRRRGRIHGVALAGEP